MQPVVSNPPIATIYRCEHGGIHLICQNVNIGLQPGSSAPSTGRFSSPGVWSRTASGPVPTCP